MKFLHLHVVFTFILSSGTFYMEYFLCLFGDCLFFWYPFCSYILLGVLSLAFRDDQQCYE